MMKIETVSLVERGNYNMELMDKLWDAAKADKRKNSSSRR